MQKSLIEGHLVDVAAALNDQFTISLEPNQTRTHITSQASFHIDLDVSLVGCVGNDPEPYALLANPEMTVPYVDELLQLKRLTGDHFLSQAQAFELIKYEYCTYAEERTVRLNAYGTKLSTDAFPWWSAVCL